MLRRVRRSGEDARALLAVRGAMVATLLGAGLDRRLERLGDRLTVPGVSGDERERRLAEFGDVLTQADTLDHVGVGFLDALVGTPGAHLDGPGDLGEGVALLGRGPTRELLTAPLLAAELLSCLELRLLL